MNACQLAQKLEQDLKSINHYLAHRNYEYSLSTGQVGEHLDILPQTYLALIPAIEALAAKVKAEVEAARNLIN